MGRGRGSEVGTAGSRAPRGKRVGREGKGGLLREGVG